MRKTRSLWLEVMLLVLFLVHPVSLATTISSTDISTELYLGQEHEAHTTVTITYENLTAKEIYYLAYSRVSNLLARDDSGPLSCNTRRLPYGTAITCTPNTMPEGEYTVVLEFDEDGVFTRTEDKYLFISRAVATSPTGELRVEVKLPPGLGVFAKADGTPDISPEEAEIKSDGRHIIVTWTITQPEQGKTYLFRVTAEEVGIQDKSQIVWLAGLLVGIIVAMGTYLVYQHRKESKSKNIIAVLKEDEKKVLEVVANSGGECIQKKIVRETGFSKPKVSRIIVELVERGLIEKEPKGRTNIVRLVDKSIASMLKSQPKTGKKTEKERQHWAPWGAPATSS